MGGGTAFLGAATADVEADPVGPANHPPDFEPGRCTEVVVTGLGSGDPTRGREKLTEARCDLEVSSSGTFANLFELRSVLGNAAGLSTLMLLLPFEGVGDITLAGGSVLLARLGGPLRSVFGSGGTGGCVTCGDLAPLRDGLCEDVRNVRSVIELELFDRCRPGLPSAVFPAPLPVVTDETEPRRIILFV